MIDELDSPTREPGDDAPLGEGNGQPMSSPDENVEAAVEPRDDPQGDEISADAGGGELEAGELEIGELEVGESGISAASRNDDELAAHAETAETEISDQADAGRDAAEAGSGADQAAGDSLAQESAGEAESALPEPAPKPKKVRTPGKPVEEAPLEEPGTKEWFILKVQSNREDSIADALQRRIAIAGLERFFDEIIVPVEKVSEFKNGKKRVVKRKIYPGYIVVHMELNDDTWFLVRETPGIGDFTGSGGKPTPMSTSDVNKIVSKQEDKAEEQITVDVRYKSGDRVRINEGTFENFEGDVDSIDAVNGRVTVMINIFGRSTPVELETWQVETL